LGKEKNKKITGKQIPIIPDVDVLIPTVTIWDVSLEANFGDTIINGKLDGKLMGVLSSSFSFVLESHLLSVDGSEASGNI
jgi:hypothetical protein